MAKVIKTGHLEEIRVYEVQAMSTLYFRMTSRSSTFDA
jgi:hypothetical protein